MCCTKCHLRFLGVTKMTINALFEDFDGSDRSLAKNRESREKTGFWSRTEAVQTWSEKGVVPSVLPVQLAMFFPIRQLSAELICTWNILIFPPSFLQENFCFESSVLRCQGWDGAVCGQVVAWPCTIASSIRWNLFIVAYDLLQKRSHLGKRKIKEEGGKKKVPLISLLFPLLFP